MMRSTKGDIDATMRVIDSLGGACCGRLDAGLRALDSTRSVAYGASAPAESDRDQAGAGRSSDHEWRDGPAHQPPRRCPEAAWRQVRRTGRHPGLEPLPAPRAVLRSAL